MKRKRKIPVTGGVGFIGSHTSEYSATTSCELIVITGQKDIYNAKE